MKNVTATVALGLAAAALAGTATPAVAGSPDGKLQVKLLGTAVLPDGKITSVRSDTTVSLPAATQTKANDNVVPTLAIEYFFTPEISLETICCLTQHDVDGTQDIAGLELVSDAKILPATFTLKYHLNAGGISPYVGAGPTYFIFIDEKPGAFAKSGLGATRLKMDDSLGVALQAGVDVPINNQGLSLSLDAKKYFLNADARWYDSSDNLLLHTKHKIDPWVLSAGLAYRF